MDNLWEVRLFLATYGNIPLSESNSLTSLRINVLKDKLSEWKTEENKAENERTTSINKTIANAFKGMGKMFG